MDVINIAENSCYSISYSKSLNRYYLKIKGYWQNPDSVSNYLKDWEVALRYCQRGFSLLTDASEMKIHPKEVVTIHEKAQELLLKAGIKKVTEILNNAFAELQLNAVAKISKFPKKNFSNSEEAEIWLNATSVV